MEAATRSELRSGRVSVRSSGLAAGAVRLARLLDAAGNASEAASGLRELRLTLGTLADTRSAARTAAVTASDAAVEAKGDRVDELASRRDRPIA